MHLLSAVEIRDLFLNGKVTALEIGTYFLNRIEKYDTKIGSFLTVYKDRVIAKAIELDEKKSSGKKLGKLAGIPIAIKDNIHVKNEMTTCASKFLINYRAPFDSTVCRLLEEEDALIIGKTNLDEFGMGSSTENSALQKTHNPWNLECSPGGSSGGSAAAVAARLCPIALGTDTGGSIRQPAALCGIAGFKPTYGRVSRYGLVAFGSSLDQIGPLAANVVDAALVMEVIGRHCEKDSTSLFEESENYLPKLNDSISGLKIGVPWQFLEGLAPEPKEAFQRSLTDLQKLGAEIIDVDLSLLKYSLSVYYILATAEASTNLARFDGIRYGIRSPRAQTLEQIYDYSKEEGFGPEVKRRILLGTYVLSAGYQDAFYKKAQKVRTLLIRSYAEAFKKCHIVATPVSPFAAFKIGAIKDPLQMYLEDIYTISINLAGLPAVSIPNGFTKDGLPFGLQLIGPQKKDVHVLNVANVLQKSTSYHLSMPKSFEES